MRAFDFAVREHPDVRARKLNRLVDAVASSGNAAQHAADALAAAQQAQVNATQAEAAATAAAASAANAGTDATAAQASATAALASANTAAAQAELAEQERILAETARGEAQTALNGANTAADAALEAAANAAVSVTSAAGSASAASGSAEISIQRATDAELYALSASASANIAALQSGSANANAIASSVRATSAQVSADESGVSAAASEVSRLAAEVANTAAGGSASAAATSATSAAASSTAAGLSASASETSRLAAEAANVAATASASAASGSAATATSAAATATSQATLSATFATNSLNSLLGNKPRGMSGGSSWYNGSAGWGFGTDGSVPVINATGGGAMDVYPKWAYVASPGRTYRLHLHARASTGTRSCFFAYGNVNTDVNPPPTYTLGVGSLVTFDTSYSVKTAEYTVPASPASPFLFFFFNIQPESGALYVRDFWVEDVTAVLDATSQASIATAQAATATAQAASATASAVLSASIGLNSLNKNPVFADWPGGSGTVPADWSDWINGSANTRVSGDLGGYAFQQTTTLGVNYGLGRGPAGMNGIMDGGYFVVEADVTLVSGTLVGSGAFLAKTGASLYLNFATDPDSTGAVVGAGTAGRRYSFRKLFQASANGNTDWTFYCMSSWGGHDATMPVKTIKWHRCSVRPATTQEIESQTVLAPLSATVASHSSAIVDAANKLAEARLRLVTAASGGNPAIFEMYSATGDTSFIALLASQIFFGDNTVFDDATDVLQTTIAGSAVNSIAWGAPFGASGANLLQWYGPTGIAIGARTKANAYFYLSTTAPRIGGTEFPGPAAAQVTIGYGQTIRKVLANGASASFSGAVGIAAGGSSSGTARARIDVSEAGLNAWSTVVQSATFPVGPGEPGQDVVSGTFTNTSGSQKVFEFRIFDPRTPGTAGGAIVGSQTFLTG